jgi:hypothetical protein
MIGTNGASSLYPGAARASADNLNIKNAARPAIWGHSSRTRLRARKIRSIFEGFFAGKLRNAGFNCMVLVNAPFTLFGATIFPRGRSPIFAS